MTLDRVDSINNTYFELETSPQDVYIVENSSLFLWCNVVKRVKQKNNHSSLIMVDVPASYFRWVINDIVYDNPNKYSRRYSLIEGGISNFYNLEVVNTSFREDLGKRKCILTAENSSTWPMLTSKTIEVHRHVPNDEPIITLDASNSFQSKVFNIQLAPPEPPKLEEANLNISDMETKGILVTLGEPENVKMFTCTAKNGQPKAKIEWRLDQKEIPILAMGSMGSPEDSGILKYILHQSDNGKNITCISVQYLNLNQRGEHQVSINLNLTTQNAESYFNFVPTPPPWAYPSTNPPELCSKVLKRHKPQNRKFIMARYSETKNNVVCIDDIVTYIVNITTEDTKQMMWLAGKSSGRNVNGSNINFNGSQKIINNTSSQVQAMKYDQSKM
ncbi:unnamed protein product [Gordionus sp. m RMFG-2023]